MARPPVIRRISNGIFGYTRVPTTYYDALIGWFNSRHNWQIEKEWVIYTSGVVPALSAIIKALTIPGDRVWTRQKLTRIGEICLQNNVLVVADEIHCELTYPGYDYTPFASISDEFLMHSVTCTSPSKAFNLAGLQIANIIAPDETLRRRIDKAININEVCDVNPFGVIALISAYTEGAEWLDALNRYLYDNYHYLRTYFSEHLPQFPVTKLEGTYLVWVDCSVLKHSSKEIETLLLEKEKLWINAGSMYGQAGEGFIRINIACPRQVLIEGLRRVRACLEQ